MKSNALLQCGFTKRGFIKNGANWLAGYGQWFSVASLLSGAQSSTSFQQLWRILQAFRQNNLAESVRRGLLEQCPWILPEWTNELLIAARQKATLTAGDDQIAEPNGLFLSPLRLRWDFVSAPMLAVEVVNIAQFDLPASRYQIAVGRRTVSTLLRQPDGTFDSLDKEVAWPLADVQTPVVEARLIGSDGVTIATQSLTVFDRDAEVTMYDLSREGERIADPWTEVLSPTRRYAVLTTPDLVSSDAPTATVPLLSGFATLYGFSAGSLRPFLLEEEPFWSPAFVRQITPSWITTLRGELHQEPDQRDSLFVGVTGCPPDVEIVRVRVDREPLSPAEEISAPSHAHYFGAFALPTRPSVVASVTLRQGDSTRTFRRVLDLADLRGTFPGAGLRQTESGWRWFDENAPLAVEAARTEPVRWLVPKEWEILHQNNDGQPARQPKWCLMEGDRWLGTVGGYGVKGRQAHPLPRNLGGYGFSLIVRPQSFNNSAACLQLPAGTKEHVVVASHLFDSGCLQDFEVKWVADIHRLHVSLNHSIEPGGGHRLLWWDASGALIPLPPTAQGNDASDWYADLPDTATEPVAVAAVFDGQRIGGAWKEDWYTRAFAGTTVPAKIAARLRFLKLPICTDKTLRVLQAYLNRTPAASVAFLTAWLGDEETAPGLPNYLSYSASDASWDAAMRCVFGDWEPTKQEAEAIITDLGEGQTDDEAGLHITMERLLAISPLLAVRAMQAMLAGKDKADRLQTRLTRRILGLSPTATAVELQNRKLTLIAQIACELGSDEAFFTQPHAGLLSAIVRSQKAGTRLTATQDENYRVAVSRSEPFRRLLAALLLAA